MPSTKPPLRAVLAAFRERGLALTTSELWAAAVRLKRAELMKAHASVDTRLLTHRDVLVLRLVDGRPTLVHRDLWPDLLAVALSGAPWQMEWLPPKDARLLEVVEEEGVVHLDSDLAERLDAAGKSLGKTLMARLLVLGLMEPRGDGTVWTLVSWWRWAEEQRVTPSPDEEAARSRIAVAAKGLAEHTRLPWHDRPLRRRWGV